MPDLTESIKRAAMQAMETSKPMALTFGAVEGEEPISIRVEQKMLLTDKQLLLPRSLTDYEVEMTIEWETNAAGEEAHRHAVTGKRKALIHGALKAGERVILLRLPGGQKYLVLDRVVE